VCGNGQWVGLPEQKVPEKIKREEVSLEYKMKKKKSHWGGNGKENSGTDRGKRKASTGIFYVRRGKIYPLEGTRKEEGSPGQQ